MDLELTVSYWICNWTICKTFITKCLFCELGYPISLLTPKIASPCPFKNLWGPALGHPEVYRVNFNLPRPPKRQVPPRGRRAGTLGLVPMKSRPTRPAFSGSFGTLHRGLQSQPRPPKYWGPRGGTPFWTHYCEYLFFVFTEMIFLSSKPNINLSV